jgi:hypothetical protein
VYIGRLHVLLFDTVKYNYNIRSQHEVLDCNAYTGEPWTFSACVGNPPGVYTRSVRLRALSIGIYLMVSDGFTSRDGTECKPDISTKMLLFRNLYNTLTLYPSLRWAATLLLRCCRDNSLSLLPYLLLLVTRPAAHRSLRLRLTLPLSAAYLWAPVSQI